MIARTSKHFRVALAPLASLLISTFVSAHEAEPQHPFARVHAHEQLEIHSHQGWDSRYLSEGRDALDGDSLFSGSFELGWEHLAAGVWYGNSPDQRYDELQLGVSLVQCLGDFEFYVGYTHFRFPFEDAHDNEVGAGLTWSELPLGFAFVADAYHSFEADGYFIELAFEREFEITDRLSLVASGQFGMNQGYVSDGHDGANHVAASLGVEYSLTEFLSIVAHGTHNWAIDSNPHFEGDEQLNDFFLAGVGIEWSF